jgi:hypothetical protein
LALFLVRLELFRQDNDSMVRKVVMLAIGWQEGGYSKAVMFILVLCVFFAAGYYMLRRRTLALREQFLDPLLQLVHQRLPLGRHYTGEETRPLVQAAAAAAERAVAEQQRGEEARVRAEQLARRALLPWAAYHMWKAAESYRAGLAAYEEAARAWAPIDEALRHWEALLAEAQGRLGRLPVRLDEERGRTGWSLSTLAERCERAAQACAESAAARDVDPVRAYRLVRAALQELEEVSGDLEALPGLESAREQLAAKRLAAAQAVEEARKNLGIRFVEVSPEALLAQAAAAEEEAMRRGALGDRKAAEAALAAGAEAIQQALSAVDKYREAVEQWSVKAYGLTRELAALEEEERRARETLETLRRHYARQDWADLAEVDLEIKGFRERLRQGLQEVHRLVSPEEQRYLQAVSLLDRWMAEREGLRRRMAALAARPSELSGILQRVDRFLERMAKDLRHAEETARHAGVLLPADVASDLELAWKEYRRLMEARQVGSMPVRQVLSEAERGADRAEELVRRSKRAVHRLQEAQAHPPQQPRRTRSTAARILEASFEAAEMAQKIIREFEEVLEEHVEEQKARQHRIRHRTR